MERHVGFHEDDEDSPVEHGMEKEGKLRRRDTPHHLKNKRIGSSAIDSAEEKVRAILAAQVGGKAMSPPGGNLVRPATPPEPVRQLHRQVFGLFRFTLLF